MFWRQTNHKASVYLLLLSLHSGPAGGAWEVTRSERRHAGRRAGHSGEESIGKWTVKQKQFFLTLQTQEREEQKQFFHCLVYLEF